MPFLCKPSTKFLLLGLLSAPGMLHATAENAEALKFFETKIRPVFAGNCYDCHGEEKQKGGLRMDNLGYILQGGEGGPAVVPGDAMASHLYKAVTYEDKDLQMPPKDKKLPDSQIEDIRKWIDMGAPWPKAEIVQAKKPGEFTEEEKGWWAFQPLKKVTPPAVGDARVANPIDNFIATGLKEKGLSQAPQASRTEMVRRLYYNLHGLPPTPAQVQAFLDDKRPDAYERLVDELLASPRYGIRWGQHWLDLARYAESDGYREDAYRPNAWPYRDYVIKSFNDDKPYNQFVREQLAGDEINPDDPNVLIGTAFLRHGIYEWNQRDAEGQRELMVNEMTDVTGELFLGLSFACARCHDHKFDPILQKDYYRLKSFFTGVQWREDVALATPEQKAAHAEQMKAWEESSKEAREAYEALIQPALDNARRKATEMFPEEVKAMVAKPDDQRTPYEKQINYLVERQVMVDQNKTLAKLKQKADPVIEAMKPFEETKPKPLPYAFVATDVGTTAPPTVLKSRRGDTDVKPGFLTILKPDELDVKPLAERNSSGRRTALADWITDPTNPLSTRVIVNRVWQFHFGRALAENTSDFGRLGTPPSNPELLDWLTGEFLANGWSFKKLHRLILTSETYRQSSLVQPTDLTNQVDPSNKLLWRMNPLRLDAEQTRDTLLMMSGELKDQISGPGVDASEPVRSIFTRKRRNSPDEFMTRFDAAPGFFSMAKRETTTTALQSLVMINGEWPLQRARVMAAKVLKDANNDEKAAAAEAIRLAYSRPGTKAEVDGVLKFLKHQQSVISKDRPVEAAPEVTNPVVDAAALFNKHFLAPSKAITFRPGTTFEKVRVASAPETPEFTVEAVVNVDSVFPDASVRTIASRWNGDLATKGWSLGLTGKTSRHKPNHLVFEITGDDFQGSLVREVVPSTIFVPDHTPFYIAAVVSNRPVEGKTFGGSITFHALNLADPKAKLVSVTVPHGIGNGYVNPERKLIIGGRDTTERHLWSGGMASVSVTNKLLDVTQLAASKPMNAPERLFELNADTLTDTYKPTFSWEKSSGVPSSKTRSSPKLEALADLFHTLINSNEFFYLP
ncbi:PSD1 and planctomycete cytochrome C domain-containing protein [Luteolibacter sp. SL250]|uniref:PSD1 and planctomycete cytochrome C domain-containing protein n=1 Tax=Luteolibacter sp. SL250 TaxID=2995170 RepID=UPI002270EA1F|nr:PSD1 and planctomycete cytochrome C domain-containing protein [Luteolibacter sp. SL250]WAC21857.1 PSD1 and planctomycete cytochrome C domain-containing protein [Luteolibacter sp. SL250]